VEAGVEAAGKPSPAHGDYFRVLADTGVMGLAAFLWLLGAVGWEAIRAYRGAIDPHYKAIALVFFAIWAAFLMMRATGNVLTHQVFEYYFWALAAATIAIGKIERGARREG
jgi:O-antigen ligase